MKATREEVYAAIDGEREYQNQRWPNPKLTIPEAILYMEDYLHLSRSDATEADFEAALMGLRKVVALGVACMEYNGIVIR